MLVVIFTEVLCGSWVFSSTRCPENSEAFPCHYKPFSWVNRTLLFLRIRSVISLEQTQYLFSSPEMKLHYMKNRLVQLYSQKSEITKRLLNLSLVKNLGTCAILIFHAAVTLLSLHIHGNCHPWGEMHNTKRQQCQTGHSPGELRKTCFQTNYRKHEKSPKKKALFPLENFLLKTNMYLLTQTKKQTYNTDTLNKPVGQFLQ